MRDYIIRRILLLIPVLFGVSVLVFSMIRFIPGDVVDAILQDTTRKEVMDEIRARWGLDKHPVHQYAIWLVGSDLAFDPGGKVGGVIRGDFGKSFYSAQPVLPEIVRRLPITLELAILALFFATVIALPVGVLSAIRQDSPLDYVSRVIAMAGISMPNFWLGTLALVLGSIYFHWIPPLGYVLPHENLGLNLQQFVLPSLILGFAISAVNMRMTRSSMLEVLRQDYVRTAWAKGLRERAVIVRHALKNAMIPVVTLMGTEFARLLGGTVVMELLFNLPGLGRLTVESIYQRDYTQLQGNVLFIATFYVVMNVVVDASYAWFDPRIRYQ